MKTVVKTKGVCSKSITIDVEDGVIKDVEFLGGCSGNTQGVARLVKGLRASDAADKLRGIDCGGKGTSCPDQLARALEQIAV